MPGVTCCTAFARSTEPWNPASALKRASHPHPAAMILCAVLKAASSQWPRPASKLCTACLLSHLPAMPYCNMPSATGVPVQVVMSCQPRKTRLARTASCSRMTSSQAHWALMAGGLWTSTRLSTCTKCALSSHAHALPCTPLHGRSILGPCERAGQLSTRRLCARCQRSSHAHTLSCGEPPRTPGTRSWGPLDEQAAENMHAERT